MRIDGLAPEPHQPGDLLHQRRGARHGAGDDVAVAVQVLGGAGDGDVRAVLERPEIDRAGEGGVHQQRQAELLRHVGHRPQVHHPHERIGGGLDEDGAGGLSHRLAPEPGLVRAHVRDVDAEPAQLLVEELPGAAVDPAAAEQVIAGAKHGQVGEGGGAHAAGEEDRVLGALEQGVLPGQLDLGRVVAVAAVDDVFVAADRTHEGAALLERRRDGGPVRPPAGDAVDGRGGGPEAGARSCDGERVIAVAVGSHQPVQRQRAEGRLGAGRDQSNGAANSPAVRAPRSQIQAKAARASALTQPSSRGPRRPRAAWPRPPAGGG